MPAIDWRPTIGDPTLIGWLTVLAYLLGSWLCLLGFRVEKSGPRRPLRETIPAALRVLRKRWPHPPLPVQRALVWLALSVLLLLLALNKQFDLQTLFTQVGRALAHSQGWYQHRRVLQAAMILFIATLGIVGVFGLWWLTRGPLRDFRLPLAGIVFIFAFVLVRASSFHKVDLMLGGSLGGVRFNWVLELSGIAAVCAGAIRRLRRADVTARSS